MSALHARRPEPGEPHQPTDTYDKYSGTLVPIGQPTFYAHGQGGHTVVGTDALLTLGLDKDLRPVAKDILMVLMGTMEKRTCRVTLTQAQVAEKMGVAVETVSRAMKTLVAGEYVHRDAIGYYVNPHMGFNGSGEHHAEMVQDKGIPPFDRPEAAGPRPSTGKPRHRAPGRARLKVVN